MRRAVSAFLTTCSMESVFWRAAISSWARSEPANADDSTALALLITSPLRDFQRLAARRTA